AAEAVKQMAEALETSYREGYAAGYEAGWDEGARSEAARLESAVRVCEEAARAVRSAEAARLAMIEDDLVALALAAARHIVGKALELEPERLVGVVRRALAQFPGEQQLEHRVLPAYIARLPTTT